MQLAFREDVVTASGEVKFPAGVIHDWPKHVFRQVAENVGKTLDELTVTPDEMGKIFAAKVTTTKKRSRAKPQPGPKPPRRRSAKKEN